jgi:hypothetical protein
MPRPTMEERLTWPSWIGKKICKRTRKPFKSGDQVATVKGMSMHEKTGQQTFTFIEDDSYVECHRCMLLVQ